MNFSKFQMDMSTHENITAGTSEDTLQKEQEVSRPAEHTSPLLRADSNVSPSEEGAIAVSGPNTGQDAPKPKRKRPSGAEVRRRRKARMASQATNVDPAASSAIIGTAGVSKENPDPARTKQIKGGPVRRRGEHPARKGPVRSSGSRVPPKTSSAKKRIRSDGSTPSHGVNPRKRRRETPGPKKAISYREAADHSLKVAIANLEDPLGRIDGLRAEFIEEMLTHELCEAAGNPDTFVPTFRGLLYAGGILRVTCADQQSLEWLSATIQRNLTGLWSDMVMAVVREDELPRLTKATVWLPGIPRDLDTAISVLARQNPSLQIARWVVFHSEYKEKEEGRLVVFGVPQQDVDHLRSSQRNNKILVFYKFQQLAIHLKKTEEAPQEPSSPKINKGPAEETPGRPTTPEPGSSKDP